jgi:hypothetical protein
MKSTCRLAGILLLLPLVGLAAFPHSVPAEDDPTDAIEKELVSVLREMDSLSEELDRIGEISAVPKATSIRIEIRGTGEIAPPVSGKLLLSGKPEADREFSREERDAFLAGSGAIVWNVPVLPGRYEARLVLAHPYAHQSPSFVFRPSLAPGETFLLRLTLRFAEGKAGAMLVASPEK